MPPLGAHTLVFTGYSCCIVPSVMHLLILGHKLICDYQTLLSQEEGVVGPDLRLVAYAIETTLLHREATSKAQMPADTALAANLLNALGDLRTKTDEYEAGRQTRHTLGQSLTRVIDTLTKYIEHDSRRTVCPLTQSDEALRIPRVILTRLLKSS